MLSDEMVDQFGEVQSALERVDREPFVSVCVDG
jgi:hypothetical protein